VAIQNILTHLLATRVIAKVVFMTVEKMTTTAHAEEASIQMPAVATFVGIKTALMMTGEVDD
jgi:hypothetical protein